jgi:chemotaxis protein histidine kinase CheA
MRSGPFSGLRDNIRALGQYASTPAAEGGSGLPEKEAQQLVSGFFRSLEEFDLVLYNAVREAKAAQDKADKENKKKSESEDEDAEKSEMVVVDPAVGLDKEAAAAKLAVAVEQLDKLIATVPEGVLVRSREVLEKVNRKTAAAAAAAL